LQVRKRREGRNDTGSPRTARTTTGPRREDGSAANALAGGHGLGLFIRTARMKNRTRVVAFFPSPILREFYSVERV
jgi:hypothetical protein